MHSVKRTVLQTTGNCPTPLVSSSSKGFSVPETILILENKENPKTKGFTHLVYGSQDHSNKSPLYETNKSYRLMSPLEPPHQDSQRKGHNRIGVALHPYGKDESVSLASQSL